MPRDYKYIRFFEELTMGGTREATRNIPTPQEERERFCISDEDALTLADYAIKVEEHYSAKAGCERPMDMEWGQGRD